MYIQACNILKFFQWIYFSLRFVLFPPKTVVINQERFYTLPSNRQHFLSLLGGVKGKFGIQKESSGQKLGIMINVLHCTGQDCTTRNYHNQHVNSAKTKKSWSSLKPSLTLLIKQSCHSFYSFLKTKHTTCPTGPRWH